MSRLAFTARSDLYEAILDPQALTVEIFCEGEPLSRGRWEEGAIVNLTPDGRVPDDVLEDLDIDLAIQMDWVYAVAMSEITVAWDAEVRVVELSHGATWSATVTPGSDRPSELSGVPDPVWDAIRTAVSAIPDRTTFLLVGGA